MPKSRLTPEQRAEVERILEGRESEEEFPELVLDGPPKLSREDKFAVEAILKRDAARPQ